MYILDSLMQASQLSSRIYQELFADAERQTYEYLYECITQLKSDRNTKMQELIGYQRRIVALTEYLSQTNKLIELQKQQLDAEFEMQLGQLKERAIGELGEVRASLGNQMLRLAGE